MAEIGNDSEPPFVLLCSPIHSEFAPNGGRIIHPTLM